MIFKHFAATLYAPLGKNEFSLPLSESDKARFLALVPDGETLPLVLRDRVNVEEIVVANECGHIVIKERGDERYKFPWGTCAGFEVTLAVVRHEICNHECCPEPGEPIAPAGILLPLGETGKPWEGSVIFSGALPMELAVQGLPGWAAAERGPNFLRLHGTPTEAGSWNISAAASGAGGLVIQQGTVGVG